MDKYSDYKDLDLAVINSNMPVHFAFVDEIIIAMTDSKCLPGEEKRTRRCKKATLLTSSPSRANLQAKQDKKRRSSTRREQKSNQRRTQKTQNVSEVPDYEEEEDWPCLQCFQLYRNSRPGAIWVQCQICLQWAHEDCTDGNPQFICPKCN